jgi:hypothetical protein
LKLKYINLQEYPNHKDLSQIGSAVCDSEEVDDKGNQRVREEVIKKGQLFESPDAVKFFSSITLYDIINHSMWSSQTKTYDAS